MSIVLPVDVKGAVLALLKASTDITTLCPAERITGNLRNVTPGQYAIAVVKSGGHAADIWAPIMYPRLDFHLYAKYGHDAMRLYLTMREVLMPKSRQVGFTAAGCQVLDVQFESEPVEMFDGDWPKLWVPAIFTVGEEPV